MKKVLVIFGGVSSEHDVSLLSAKSVIENIPANKYEIVAIGITKDGRWLRYTGDVKNLPEDRWLERAEFLTPATFSPDRVFGGLLVFENGITKQIKVDVAFAVLHGKNGEDGTIQGLFQLAGIAFVGCDMISSAMCMDKIITNTIADSAGILQAKWLGVNSFEYDKDPKGFLQKAENFLGFPIFVKPANAGSSVGINKATSIESLETAVLLAFQHDKKIVLEESIVGVEVECAVLGNNEPIASVVGEVVACNEFYDYEAKYIAPNSELHIPARLSDEKLDEIRAAARHTYKVLGCSGLARVDFFVRKSDGAVLLNEPNTIPGFTSISMYPKLFAACGISYSELLDKLLTLAMEKWGNKK